jgi:hypothetical protein
MRLRNLPLIVRHLGPGVRNRAGKRLRMVRQFARQRIKGMREAAKRVRASLAGGLARGRDAGAHARSGVIRTARYWRRVQLQTTPRVAREMAVRRELRAAARGSGPIIVGPWLSEVGYEALYWVPFLRWFCDRYHVHRSRLVVVSRGGVSDWYRDIADRYVELLELMSVEAFAAANAGRQRGSEQKQHTIAAFDRAVLARVRERPGLGSAALCHPSAMFRLLRGFWLGNESLEYVQEHMRYARLVSGEGPCFDLPALPESFVAVKFYTGKAIPDSPVHRQRLRDLVARLAERSPIVALDTGIAIDDHEDYLFRDVANVISLARWSTPANNLGVQTAVIRRARQFVGTCGGLAWLAPFLGTDTVAVYADEDFLAPHLYAARQAYRAVGAARFSTLDLDVVSIVGLDGALVGTAHGRAAPDTKSPVEPR